MTHRHGMLALATLCLGAQFAAPLAIADEGPPLRVAADTLG